MAETPNVMPQLHMPLQSGSDRMLKAMRRSYRQAKYLGIIERVRAAMPDAAITTDIIVGFPGETEEDFEATLDVVRQARFSGRVHLPLLQAPRHAGRDDGASRCRATSSRSGTTGWSRWSTTIAWEENQRLVGRRVELLVAEGEGRKDAATHRLSGRGPDNRLVHFTPAGGRRDRGPATWSRSRSRTPPRTTWSPTARSSTYAAPAPATPGRPGPRPRSPGRGRSRHAGGRRTRPAAGRPRLLLAGPPTRHRNGHPRHLGERREPEPLLVTAERA